MEISLYVNEHLKSFALQLARKMFQSAAYLFSLKAVWSTPGLSMGSPYRLSASNNTNNLVLTRLFVLFE